MRKLCAALALFLALFGTLGGVRAQTPTVGLLQKLPGSYEGYTLFAPNFSTYTYLIDHDGQLVNRWEGSSSPGLAAYLLENGNLLRTARFGAGFGAGGSGGRIEEYDWEGNLVWGYNYSATTHRQHHDAIKLPNGNVLILAWELKSYDEAVAAGRNPGFLSISGIWPMHLVEVEPVGSSGGTIVWEWHVWDHLIQDFDEEKDNFGVVADHPELLDMNFSQTSAADMLHCNGIAYNEELDQIAISVHRANEVWIIDHSTTTAEAAGHAGGLRGKGGDILYRWGNPVNYGAGEIGDQQLWEQHNVSWVPPGYPGAGNLTIFNNGRSRPTGNASSVIEIEPPMDAQGNYLLTKGEAYGPAAPVWVYEGTPPTSFYASFISGAHRLPNGNTMICDGPRGRFIEVTTDLDIVWEYLSPAGPPLPVAQGQRNSRDDTFRAVRYGVDYPGLIGKDLTPLGPVELQAVYVFELTDLERSETDLLVRWESLPDVSYRVEYSADADGEWAEVGLVTAIGTSTVFRDSDAGRLASKTGFYRVVELPGE